MTNYYKAPWCASLVLMSAAVSVILIGLPLFSLTNLPLNAIGSKMVMVSVPLVILVGGLLFMVRGYRINNSTLFIQRLFWKTEISLNELKSVEILPNAMQKSIRTMGNGGLFSFSGQFRNQTLGNYRAFATDGKRTVVLHFLDKKVVVTPDEPKRFAAELGALVVSK
jgi:hypothetical protein